jgi:hypothetical protein
MRRFGSMHEQCRRAGGGEGRGNFSGNMARLADPGHNHTLTAANDHVYCRGEGVVDMVRQLMECISLHCDYTAPNLQMPSSVGKRRMRFFAMSARIN